MDIFDQPGNTQTSHSSGLTVISVRNLAWAAGFLEGEAGFGRGLISVGQVQRWPLEELQTMFGGRIYLRRRQHYNPKWQDAY